MISPLAIRGSHSAFWASLPAITRPWLPIPTLVPKVERKAGVVPPSSSATRTSSPMVRPRPPYSSGMERPNSPISRISATTLGRHLVLAVDPLLERTKPLAHEAADGGEEQVEGFGVQGHSRLPIIVIPAKAGTLRTGSARRVSPRSRLPPG